MKKNLVLSRDILVPSMPVSEVEVDTLLDALSLF